MTTPEQAFAHRSLAYIREVSGKPIPLAPSVKALAKTVGELPQREPRVGDILLWPNVSRYGDCSIYLGWNSMLMLRGDGPKVVRFNYYGAATFLILEVPDASA